MRGKQNCKRQGFTIVELVIVIAVIAILAGVLIPTFSSVVEKARQSTDVATVTNINKMLAIESAARNHSLEFDEVKTVLAEGGYAIPCVPDSEDHTFYWLPEENCAVLYDEQAGAVKFPKEYAEREKAATWVDLAEGVPPVQDPEEEPEEEPEAYTLVRGAKFNSAVKELLPSVTKIVFGKEKVYADTIGAKSVSVSSSGRIKAYQNGTEIYVLCDEDIRMPADVSGMFEGLSSLQSIAFGHVDASAVTNTSRMFADCTSLSMFNLAFLNGATLTDMSAMFLNCSSLAFLDVSMLRTANVTSMENTFNGCAALTDLQLSTFNTAKVTTMKNMFYGCTALASIRVKSGAQGFVVTQVSSSSNMFGGCSKLKNYRNDLLVGTISEIFGSDQWSPGLTHDKTYAHTGDGGYLTEA